MRVPRAGSSLLSAALLALTGCATQPPPAPVETRPVATAVTVPDTGAEGGVLYHWVQVVSRAAIGGTGSDSYAPVLVARAVVDNADSPCPMITAVADGSSASARMVPREANEDPEAFPILVCEARVPMSADAVTIGGRPLGFSPGGLGALAGHPVLVGDTGCKGPEDCPPEGSAPDDPAGWGFPKVAGVIAAGAAPSVLVHVGDYLYRRMPEEPGCAEKDPCDIWTAWEEDFFAPAAGLLSAAPWLMARGNHEICTSEPRVEGGNGWFLLFSPVTSCMDSGHDLPGCSQQVTLRTCETEDAEFPAPWAVDLSLPPGATAPAVRAVVMDTSAGKEVNPSTAEVYRRQYQNLAAMLDGARRGWIVTHIPIYAVSKIKGSTDQKLESVNENLQTATRGLSLPPALEMALVGHRHIVQTMNTDNMTNAALVPPHLVMGASGVALSGKKLPLDKFYGTTEAGISGDGSATLSGWIQRYHSYADLMPDTGRVAWRVTIIDAAGKPRANCNLSTGTPGWGTALTCKASGP